MHSSAQQHSTIHQKLWSTGIRQSASSHARPTPRPTPGQVSQSEVSIQGLNPRSQSKVTHKTPRSRPDRPTDPVWNPLPPHPHPNIHARPASLPASFKSINHSSQSIGQSNLTRYLPRYLGYPLGLSTFPPSVLRYRTYPDPAKFLLPSTRRSNTTHSFSRHLLSHPRQSAFPPDNLFRKTSTALFYSLHSSARTVSSRPTTAPRFTIVFPISSASWPEGGSSFSPER